MQFFNKKFFKFFNQLEKNNNKEWFDAHRPIYEKEVRQPLKELVSRLIDLLQKDFPEINSNPSKCIYRINRDIRFSKDKTPYKKYVAAVFSRTGTRDWIYPGYYFQLSLKDAHVGGGLYWLEKENIEKVRQEIYYNPEEFSRLINGAPFKKIYGEILGTKNKVLSPEYKEFSKEQPLIANKNFYYMASLSPEDILGNEIDEVLYEKYFKPAMKLNRFLLTAIDG